MGEFTHAPKHSTSTIVNFLSLLISPIFDPVTSFAILVNSGNANAFTGENGHSSVKHIMNALSDKIGLNYSKVKVDSVDVSRHSELAKKYINVYDDLMPVVLKQKKLIDNKKKELLAKKFSK